MNDTAFKLLVLIWFFLMTTDRFIAFEMQNDWVPLLPTSSIISNLRYDFCSTEVDDGFDENWEENRPSSAELNTDMEVEEESNEESMRRDPEAH